MGKERLTVIELVVILTKNKLRRSALNETSNMEVLLPVMPQKSRQRALI